MNPSQPKPCDNSRELGAEPTAGPTTLHLVLAHRSPQGRSAHSGQALRRGGPAFSTPGLGQAVSTGQKRLSLTLTILNCNLA